MKAIKTKFYHQSMSVFTWGCYKNLFKFLVSMETASSVQNYCFWISTRQVLLYFLFYWYMSTNTNDPDVYVLY